MRIEDTDQARSKKEFLDEIIESLKWLGLDWDELYYQSKRFDIYKEYSNKLLDEGKAYLAEDGSGAVILKMPHEMVSIEDLIHGTIKFDTSLIKDQVLIKSDQSPTYNFACVVDDSTMKITHIIRGDDHISNTPKQIVIYKALGLEIPQFAHIPMILGAGGGRMSKRTGATAITEYRRMGFLSEALVNYLMLLGWSPGNNQEIITLKEAVEKFSIAKVNKTAAAFNMDKLVWLNGQYIKSCSPEGLLSLLKPVLKDKNLLDEDNFDGKYMSNILKLYLERATTLVELADSIEPFLAKDITIEPQLIDKYFSVDLSAGFTLLRERFSGLDNFICAEIEEAFRSAVTELNGTVKQYIHPLRVALSGKTVGPGMFEFIEALGREKTIKRMENAIGIFQKDYEKKEK